SPSRRRPGSHRLSLAATTTGSVHHHLVAARARRTHACWPDDALLPRPCARAVGRAAHTYTLEYPTTADGALAFVERWWQGWRTGLEAGGDERLWEPYGAVEGDFPEMNLSAGDPFINMVLHTHREL